jgi:hypothetical protein
VYPIFLVPLNIITHYPSCYNAIKDKSAKGHSAFASISVFIDMYLKPHLQLKFTALLICKLTQRKQARRVSSLELSLMLTLGKMSLVQRVWIGSADGPGVIQNLYPSLSFCLDYDMESSRLVPTDPS